MSDSTLLDIATDKLWADFSEELSFPAKRPLLAHYTSIQTFERIISAEEFWFSNPLFMNDLEELKFGMNEGAAAFYRSEDIKEACGTKERHEGLINHFDFLFSEFDSKYALNTYLLCFSEHEPQDNDGLLSMWRGYANGGSGAAIVIDTSKLNSMPESPLIVGKVHYGSKVERLTWINHKISELASVISEHAQTDEDLFNAAWVWFHRLKSFALFTKHSGFREEKEWRVVYMSDRDREQRLKPYFSHLATNRGIEPKLKLPIKPIEGLTGEDLSTEKLIDRIILGPSIASVLGVSSLKQMLKNIDRGALAERVIASDIPFRPTN